MLQTNSAMRVPFVLAIVMVLIALMSCVLQTPEAESTAPPTTDEATAPTAALPTSAAPNISQTVAHTPTLTAGSGGITRQYSGPPPLVLDPDTDYLADFRTNQGNFRVRLFTSQAPITVNNFVFLAQNDFYDGLVFHRVIDNFMIQGGDPTGTGAGGPGYQFQDEIVPGVVFDGPGKLAMANAGPGTNGSQFFITVAATDWLNGRHTIFGEVTENMSVVDTIAGVATSPRDVPLQKIVIDSIDITQVPRQ